MTVRRVVISAALGAGVFFAGRLLLGAWVFRRELGNASTGLTPTPPNAVPR